MAYLDATDLLDIQESNASNEKRFSQLGLIDAVKDSTPFVDYLSPSAKEKMRTTSSLRDIQTPVIQDQTVTVNTTPGFPFIPDNLPTSAQYTFTAVDVFSGFRHYPAQFANNAMDEAFTKQQVMKNVLYGMGNTVETLLATTLELRKSQLMNFTTQINQADGTYTFNAGTDTLEINKAAQKETMFSNLNELMSANDLAGEYKFITSPAGMAIQRQQAAMFGPANSENLQALGFVDSANLYRSNNIAAGSDVFNGWMFRNGSMGVFENFPYDFVSGTSFAGKEWSITPTPLPFTRMQANIYVNNEASNAEALVGAGTDTNMTMTHFQEMAIWNRFYIVFPYNSDLTTRVSDVVKIKGLTT